MEKQWRIFQSIGQNKKKIQKLTVNSFKFLLWEHLKTQTYHLKVKFYLIPNYLKS